MIAVANRSKTLNGPFDWNTGGEWTFGYWTYDCKNHLENLQSDNAPISNLDEAMFYHPEVLISIKNEVVHIESDRDPQEVYTTISNFAIPRSQPGRDFVLHCRTSKETYKSNVKLIKEQILKGDFYEINYCIAPYIEKQKIDPVDTFLSLNKLTQAPFSCLQKIQDQYLICGSPERFIKKTGNQIISQPIKGTIRRGLTVEEDKQLRIRLAKDEKEQAENVMIVDLVRNDLAKSSKIGSVKVDELFGIYTFPFWHQMISSVVSEKLDDIQNIDIIKNAFPMGSMTGAPKIQAMKMIDEYENFQRGIYSGTVGYFEPSGDFDFNVVIRSIIYDERNHSITLPVGSAITYDSSPEQEWHECWLKAEGMIKALNHASIQA